MIESNRGLRTSNSMLSDNELTTLFLDPETERVKRFESIKNPDCIQQTICAFANDLPDSKQMGVLFIGVRDNGDCANLNIDDQLLQTLAAMRGDGKILPFPVMSVEKRIINGCELAVVIVEPAESPPVRCDGRVWVRVGPTRAIASIDEERRLAEKRRHGDVSFDRRPVTGASLSDLDLDLFVRTYLPSAIAADVLAENHRSLEHQLASLHFLTPAGIPNVAALLVLGKDPMSWIPNAYVQFVRFDGVDLTDPIRHQMEITGPLSDQVRRLDDLLQAQILMTTDVTSHAKEQRFPDYPLVALQQITRNALMHRNYESTNAPVRVYWYSDRIEIHSPGGPFGQANRTNFAQPGVTDYRNPLLAEAMKSLGFVQRFGLGFPLARKELAKNGNPEPTFEIQENAILITLRRRT